MEVTHNNSYLYSTLHDSKCFTITIIMIKTITIIANRNRLGESQESSLKASVKKVKWEIIPSRRAVEAKCCLAIFS